MTGTVKPYLKRLTRLLKGAPPRAEAGEKPHFVADYERQVAAFTKHLSLDDAMSLAVGGDYEAVGAIEAGIMRHYGLQDGMSLVDFGCGSGRLAHALSKVVAIDYLGIDIVEPLIDYARTKTPERYRYVISRSLTLPVPDASADMFAVFSVFTHLNHIETYIYLEEIFRALKPGGRVVMSFLEFAEPIHWEIFLHTVAAKRAEHPLHLNQFVERNALALWSERIGYQVLEMRGGAEPLGAETRPLGQSLAVLVKP